MNMVLFYEWGRKRETQLKTLNLPWTYSWNVVVGNCSYFLPVAVNWYSPACSCFILLRVKLRLWEFILKLQSANFTSSLGCQDGSTTDPPTTAFTVTASLHSNKPEKKTTQKTNHSIEHWQNNQRRIVKTLSQLSPISHIYLYIYKYLC